jgi:hypothetical protein
MGQDIVAMERLSEICDQAVRAHGPDWARIREYIRGTIDLLPPVERDDLNKAVTRMLAFQAPDRAEHRH